MSSCTVRLSGDDSARDSASERAEASPERYEAAAFTAARSRVDDASEAEIEDRTSSYWCRASWARSCRIRTASVLLELNEDVSKSMTSWYCDWWKAVWMLTSSVVN